MPATHSQGRDQNPLRRMRLLMRLTGAVAFAVSATLVTAGASGAALAAPDSSGATVTANTGALEEIVVTATRREENISKVPISITALSQNALDTRGIRDFTDIVRFTPGVSLDTSGTNAIAIRGISSSGGAGTTGIYIDDTPIQSRALGFNPDDTLPKTFDLDRVEVLRGPQGTLFGAGSEGGTVRYIMTQPSVTKDSTYIRSEASYTQHGDPSYEAGIAHGGPLVDNVLGFRASAWYRHDGGWINRVDETTGAPTESNANHGQTIALRLAFLYQPIESVKITPGIVYQSKQQHDLSTYWPAYSNPGAGRFNNATPERIPVPDQYYLPSLKIQVDFEHMSFISNSSYYHRNERDSYQGTAYDLVYYEGLGWPSTAYSSSPNFGCGPTSTTAVAPCSWYPLLDGKGVHLPPGFANYSTPNTIINQQRTVAQEFRLQSTDRDSRWNWTVGAFWSLAQQTSIEELNDPNIYSLLGYLYGIAPADLDAYYGPYYSCNGVGAGTEPIPNCDIYYNRNRSHDRQLAGFGEATYKFTDQLSLTVGGRYAKLASSLTHFGDGYENFGPVPSGGTKYESAFTPKVGLNLQADERNLYYFTYAKGFRPGGFNSPLPVSFCGPGVQALGYASGESPSTYKSDTTQSVEIGSKNNLADRVKLATSVYYIKWNDIQQNVYVPGSCGLQFTDNLGTAVAKGFDFQVEANIVGGLSLDFSAGYTSARFTKTSLGNRAVAGDAISGSAAINYSPGTSPPWTLAAGPQYAFRLLDHDAFVRADWEFTSRNPWLAAVQDINSSQYNQFSTTLPATSFTSLRAGIKLGGWDVSAFCDNLFDSHTVLNYALVQNDAGNPTPVTPQQNSFTFRPRTIGITGTFRL
jgi:iron complex outermembrane receptor protein